MMGMAFDSCFTLMYILVTYDNSILKLIQFDINNNWIKFKYWSMSDLNIGRSCQFIDRFILFNRFGFVAMDRLGNWRLAQI